MTSKGKLQFWQNIRHFSALLIITLQHNFIQNYYVAIIERNFWTYGHKKHCPELLTE